MNEGDDMMSDQSAAPEGFHKRAETEIHRGYVMRVAEVTFEAPAGEEFTRDVIYMPGAVAIVVLDTRSPAPEMVFVRQYRAPLERLLLEIPAGLRDVPGEPPEVTAQRELAEEVGLTAGRLDHLGSYVAAAGVTDQRVELYLARDLSETPSDRHGVEEDYMTVERHTVDQAWQWIRDGTIVDAKTIIGLTLAREFLTT